MLTREQVLDSCEQHGQITKWIHRLPLAKAIASHDAEQRQTIEAQAQEIRTLQDIRIQITASIHDDEIPSDEPLSLEVEDVRELRQKYEGLDVRGLRQKHDAQAQRIRELEDMVSFLKKKLSNTETAVNTFATIKAELDVKVSRLEAELARVVR